MDEAIRELQTKRGTYRDRKRIRRSQDSYVTKKGFGTGTVVRTKTGGSRISEKDSWIWKRIDKNRYSKKVQVPVLEWFRANIDTYNFSMEKLYKIAGITRQGFPPLRLMKQMFNKE